MKEETFKVAVKDKEYNGYKFKQLVFVINGKEYILGTLKEGQEVNYINCISKKRN